MQFIDDILNQLLENYGETTTILIVIIVFSIVNLLLWISLSLLNPYLKKNLNTHPWRYYTFKAIIPPLLMGLYVWCIYNAISYIFQDSLSSQNYASYIRIIYIALTVWAILRLKKLLLNAWKIHISKASDSKWNISSITLISRIVSAIIIGIASLFLLHELGYNTTSILAFGGIGSIIIGMASQQFLSNYITGFILVSEKPFQVNSYISSPNTNIEGTVEHIGWRVTQIRTLQGTLLYIPNALFSTITIENYSTRTHRRLKETIGIRYEDYEKLETILSSIKAYIIKECENILIDTPLVCFNQYADSSLNILVIVDVNIISLREFYLWKEKILFDIMNIINKENAQIAYPTSSIHLLPAAK